MINLMKFSIFSQFVQVSFFSNKNIKKYLVINTKKLNINKQSCLGPGLGQVLMTRARGECFTGYKPQAKASTAGKNKSDTRTAKRERPETQTRTQKCTNTTCELSKKRGRVDKHNTGKNTQSQVKLNDDNRHAQNTANTAKSAQERHTNTTKNASTQCNKNYNIKNCTV